MQAGDKLLPDDYVFAGVDGRLVQTGADKWAFEFESAAKSADVEIKAGQTLEMLGSATLEKMIMDAKERNDAMFRDMGEGGEIRGEELFVRGILSVASQDRQARRRDGGNEPKMASECGYGRR